MDEDIKREHKQKSLLRDLKNCLNWTENEEDVEWRIEKAMYRVYEGSIKDARNLTQAAKNKTDCKFAYEAAKRVQEFEEDWGGTVDKMKENEDWVWGIEK